MTPRSWSWRWIGPTAAAARLASARRSRARANGSSGCRASDGGWGAFDADNSYEYLNNIPFSDHGALLDPPTADLTARCLSMLAQLGEKPATSPAMKQALDFLRRDQRTDGSWYGRWGMNYIYGTWSVLCALNAASVPHDAPEMRRAVELACVHPEPRRRLGRGRDELQARLSRPRTRAEHGVANRLGVARPHGGRRSRSSRHRARRSPICAARRAADGLWAEQHFTATGFPRVFYLRYHGYPKFFPLWALARYRNLKAGNMRAVAFGM